MNKVAVILSVAAIYLGAQLHFAVADDMSTYDVRKSCKVDVQAYEGHGNPAACLADEQRARDAGRSVDIIYAGKQSEMRADGQRHHWHSELH